MSFKQFKNNVFIIRLSVIFILAAVLALYFIYCPIFHGLAGNLAEKAIHITNDYFQDPATTHGFCVRCKSNWLKETTAECSIYEENGVDTNKWLFTKEKNKNFAAWYLPWQDYKMQMLSLATDRQQMHLGLAYLLNPDLVNNGLGSYTDNWRLNLTGTIFNNVAAYQIIVPFNTNAQELRTKYLTEDVIKTFDQKPWYKVASSSIIKEGGYIDDKIDPGIGASWQWIVKKTAPSMSLSRSDDPEIQANIKYSYGYGNSIVNNLRSLMDKYQSFIAGKRGVIVGSMYPWIEIDVLMSGASHVTTLEYMNLSQVIPANHPRLKHIHPFEVPKLLERGEIEEFDFAVSYSSIEHSGLGRYGDPINKDADLMELAKLSCLVKPGGFLFFGVPTGGDCVYMNLHRFYGVNRYQLLMECWRLVEYESFPEFDCKPESVLKFVQPWFIFQNLRGCQI